MHVKWKQGPRFKPAVILKRIDTFRTVDPSGVASFSGFELEDCLPTLHSMLEFPPAAAGIDTSTLVWQGLGKVGLLLSPEAFLAAVNQGLRERLATKEQLYCLLTTLSLDKHDVSRRTVAFGCEIHVLDADFPRRFASRESLLDQHEVPAAPTPGSYSRVIVKTKEKSPRAAFHKAMRALDFQRALWCLMCNPRMQLTFGTPSLKPINVVRPGSLHTIHLNDGVYASDDIWFEPNFAEASLFRIDEPAFVKKTSTWALRQIGKSSYGDRIVSSLVRFVRALDESDSNSAFIRLWGALEALATPGQADYDKLVQRCSFLFKEGAYHKQVLEHLREYRNANIHAGEESDRARTLCFQLQMYYDKLLWFHVRNATYFRSLDEANYFLDSPSNAVDLNRRLELVRKAIRFTA